MSLYHLQAAAAFYLVGLVLAFALVAYSRAINWEVPRWAFIAWPLLVLWSPFWLLLRANAWLERWFAEGLVEERKKTRKVDMDRILKGKDG